MPTCATSSQLRLCPSTLLSSGSGTRSIIGAQKTLIEYIMPTQLKKPMVVRLISASVSQADKVENTSRKGRPAEKPRNSMPITRGRE